VEPNHRAIQLLVEFDRTLLSHVLGEGGVPAWNRLVERLLEGGLTPPTWTAGGEPEPLGVLLDFTRLRMPHHRLDGINLRLCWLAGADLTGASLRNARLGCGRNVSYKGSRLDNADFRHVEVSGCDFTGCVGLETALFEDAAYDPANPPVGLPADIIAVCKPEAEPPPDDRRQPTNPMEPSGFRQAPLRCNASIHLVPVGGLR